MHEEAYRVYISDTMQLAYQLNIHYVDMLKPTQEANPEDIINNVMSKGGLRFGE